ncbi:MAG: glycoside hydrolase family 47 [Candidatus Latescibacteria bacterium]|nr:glycoside hydrolase family 47 [Candidatus Latescibacterota bacterium]NIO57385.1 glycoside hydrolase family 47 [Candidatus Latescibacterota bacterium]
MKKLILIIALVCMTFGCSDDESKAPVKKEALDKELLAERVKAEFLHAWEGYKKYAWGHDELKPLSKGYRDWHKKPLLMTPVDAFSTMKIMRLDREAEEAKNLILESLSFDIDMDVQLFEINIRSLGSLLSAYQLDGDERFLKLAVDLASRLLPAFDSRTGMPYRYVNLASGKTKDPLNNPAEIGTLLLEWGTLSKITGNPIYYQKAKRAVQALFNKRSNNDLVGTAINVETGKWQDTESHISARIDSYYEYLLKSWLMFGDRDIKKMWDTSIKAVNKHLADEAESGFWYRRVDMNTTETTSTYFGALDAFFPAVLALSGDLERAAKLQKSCYKMWMLYEIEPEMIDYSTMEVVADYYILRPENIESVYYLYHFTEDSKYLGMGKEYFENLVKYCRNDVAYAHLKSVKTKEQQDAMESFFLAETMKYFYLIFAPKETVDFDEVIFNTEAHPLKIWRVQ